MATKQITAELLLKGVDRTGRAFASVSRRLGAIDKKAKAVDAHNRRRFTATENRRIAAIGRTSALFAGVTAYATAGAIKTFAESERQLTRIGLTAGATRKEMTKTHDQLLKIGNDVAMPYQSTVDGVDTLSAAGLNMKEIMDMMPSVAATAQASGAVIQDVANSAVALTRHFKINANEMQKAFDLMVAGGEAGQFEAKDTARYLATLAPAMAALGYTGSEGFKKLIVELQVVREQTGTAEEAATNFQAVLQKMETDRTAKKFAKFGIDLRKELEAGRKAGEDIIDTFAKITRKALKGDLSKIPQLFADAHFAKGMRAKLMSADAAERYAKALNSADGTVIKNLNRLLKDQKTELDRLGVAWTGLVNKIGSKVAPPVTGAINSVLTGLNQREATQKGLAEYKKRYGETGAEFMKNNGRAARNPEILAKVMADWVEADFRGDPFTNYRTKKARNKRLEQTYIPGTGDHHPHDYIPIPTARPNGTIPIPLSRAGIASRQDADELQQLRNANRAMASQYAQYGQGRQIGEATQSAIENAAQRRSMGRPARRDEKSGNYLKNLGSNRVSIETKAAEKNVGALNNLMSNFSQSLSASVDLNTSAAEAKLDRLINKAKTFQNVSRSLGNSSRSDMNTGRSMPTAGSINGIK